LIDDFWRFDALFGAFQALKNEISRTANVAHMECFRPIDREVAFRCWLISATFGRKSDDA